MSQSQKLQSLHLLNHIAVVIYCVYAGALWPLAVSFGIWLVIGTFGISGCYHRLVAHRSYECPKWLEVTFATIGCFATFGSPITWASAHRLHHAKPDVEGDPHSPHLIGVARSYFHIWTIDSIPRQFLRDLLKNKQLMFLHKNYFKIVLSWAALWYIIDWKLGVIMYSAPAMFGFHATGLVDCFCHKYGYRNFDTKDFSTNLWWVSLVACGEGFHNNHHYKPASHRLGMRWFEFDMTAFALETLGLAKKPAPEPKLVTSKA